MDKGILKKIEESKETKYLDLDNTGLNNYSFLKELTWLKKLDLSFNGIKDLGLLSPLKNLESLSLINNQIEDLSPISGLKSLSNLYLPVNQITDLTPLSNLTELTELYLRGNKISDVSPIARLKKLKVLDLRDNNIRDLKPIIPLLESRIKTVKSEVSDSLFGQGIYLNRNPIETPGPEILQKGREAILNYFKELKSASRTKLFEAKILLVGEGGVGKTSLAVKLENPEGKLPEKEERTRGIMIKQLTYPYQNSKLHLNIWDFGGQDIYHATHRFFLTKRSLYVLLTETRRQDDNFDYWIPNIRLFGANSPILVIKNQFLGHQRNISIGQYLKNDEFNIIGNIEEVDLKSGNGVERVSKIIFQQAENLPLFGNLVPSTYLSVKERLSKLSKTKPYISIDTYLKICAEEKIVDNDSAFTLAEYLHDLGTILWYKEIPGLKEKVIIQPEWATNAVYLIIDDERVINKAGTFNKLDIQRLWSDPSYSRLHDELLLLLSKFKLCYKKKTKQEWVIPSLLPLDPPADFSWTSGQDLIFQFSYTFMPKGMVNQLTAQLDRYIKDDGLVWGIGVILSDGNNEAFVQEDRLKRKVVIRVKGVSPSSFMGILINEMENIHVTYPGIEVEKHVPCGCKVCKESGEPDMIQHDRLIERLENRKQKWFCNKGDSFISINELLFRVGIEEVLEKYGRDFNMLNRPPKPKGRLYKQVSELIARGDTRDCLKEAMSLTKERWPEVYEDLVLLSAMFNKLEKKYRRGGMEYKDYETRISRIHDGILEAIREMEE